MDEEEMRSFTRKFLSDLTNRIHADLSDPAGVVLFLYFGFFAITVIAANFGIEQVNIGTMQRAATVCFLVPFVPATLIQMIKCIHTRETIMYVIEGFFLMIYIFIITTTALDSFNLFSSNTPIP